MSSTTRPPETCSPGPKHRWHRAAGILAVLVLQAAVATACGNAIDVVDTGHLGITVDQSGEPAIAVMTCTAATPVITLSEGRKPADPDDQPNVERGSWRAQSSFAGVAYLRMSGPDQKWRTDQAPGTLQPDRLFVVNAGTTEDDEASLIPVSFTTAQIERIPEGRILVDGKTESPAEFAAYQCR